MSVEGEAHPRLELRIEKPSVPPASYFALALALLFVASAIVRQPFLFGAPIVVPLLFLFAGAAAVRPRRVPLVVRFFEDALEVSGEGFRRRLPWSAVATLTETSAGLSIHVEGGQPLLVPREQLPADRRALLEALPPSVAFERGEEPKPKRGAAFYVVLWLFFLLFFVAAWELVHGG